MEGGGGSSTCPFLVIIQPLLRTFSHFNARFSTLVFFAPLWCSFLHFGTLSPLFGTLFPYFGALFLIFLNLSPPQRPPTGNFWIMEGARGTMGRGKGREQEASLLSFSFPAFTARCRFSLSPGPRPAATTARKKWTKEASAEERVLELLLAAILNKWKIGLTRPLYYYYFALFKIQNPRRFASGIPSFSRLVMSLATRPNQIPPWLYTVPYSL